MLLLANQKSDTIQSNTTQNKEVNMYICGHQDIGARLVSSTMLRCGLYVEIKWRL